MSDELKTAIDAAKAGAKQAIKYFNQGISYKMKEDKSPVTKADFESESAIKSYIVGKYPHAKVFGEEAGGRFTNLQGGEWTFDESSCLASNGLIHDEVLRIYNS